MKTLHFELVPPTMYANANQEQSFACSFERSTHVPSASDGTPNLAFVCARVSVQNRVRMARVDANMVLHKDTASAAPPGMTVPLMLHYEPASVVVTCKDSSGTQLWQKIVHYVLPEDDFPRHPLSSTWKRQTDSIVACTLTMAQMAQETFAFHPDEKTVVFESDDKQLALRMTIQQCCNVATKEPMTFYQDRVYSPRCIAVVTDASLL